MKTKLIFTLSLTACLFVNAFSQNCNRVVSSFTQYAGGYTITGTAKLERLPSDSLKLTFSSNFNTSEGPALFVYLTKLGDAPTAAGNTHFEVAPLISNSGAQTYLISDTVDLNLFNHVVIHCKQFNHVWGGGLLGMQSGNCISTGIDNNNLDVKPINIFPNPTLGSATIIIENIIQSSVLNIYDVAGKLILTKNSISESEIINVQNFESGIYFVEVLNNGNNYRKKIIVSK